MRLQVKLPPPALHNVPLRIPLEGAGAARERPCVRLADCRRILVVKLDHIGDWVLCTPFLENLRRNAPRAQIDVVVLPRAGDLASACPHADRVVALGRKYGEAFDISAPRWTDATSFQRDYAGGAFDLAVVPRWDADFEGAARIAWGSRARFIVGFSEYCTRRKRVINRGDDRFYTHAVDDRTIVHEVEHNLNLIEAMNGRATVRQTAVHTSEGDEQAARCWLARRIGACAAPLIALAPFASEPKRELTIREFANLAHQIGVAFRSRFVVLGGPDDRLRGARLAALLRPVAVSAAGELNIRETAALIRRCDALVGVDSAPAHLAAAVGTSVAVLSCHPAVGSPNHANSPARFAPWGSSGRPNILVLQPASPTLPCRDCCQAAKPHCILGIDANARARLMTFIGQTLGEAAAMEVYAAHE